MSEHAEYIAQFISSLQHFIQDRFSYNTLMISSLPPLSSHNHPARLDHSTLSQICPDPMHLLPERFQGDLQRRAGVRDLELLQNGRVEDPEHADLDV